MSNPQYDKEREKVLKPTGNGAPIGYQSGVGMLENYQSIPFTLNINFFKIPVTMFDMTEEGAEEFNSVMEQLETLPLNSIIRTKSGGISTDRRNWSQFPCWDIKSTRSMVEVTVITKRCYRFQFRHTLKGKTEDENQIGGRTAFLKFIEVCKKYGVDIKDFKLPKEEGMEVKKTIPSPLIDITAGVENVVWTNVHHIDLHSAHMSGIAIANPVLRDPISEIYNLRKANDTYKAVLTHTWGYCQSQYVGYGYSQLSKDGIEWTNKTITELTKRLTDSGRLVLMHNTDGIWYTGPVYHGDGEGDGIGQWSNDYHDCKFRAKSKGAYEFIGYKKNETVAKYHAVVRGQTLLDKIKPRDEWQWGDIYENQATQILGFAFINNRIVKEYTHNED